jgi:hypothetical protein
MTRNVNPAHPGDTMEARMMKNVLLAAMLAIGLPLVGCGGGEVCSGEYCECTSGTCSVDCVGAGCHFQCAPGTSCDNSCAEGGCNMECTDAESCALDCPGGGCQVHCTGSAECRVTSCTDGCELVCGGAAVCESSCVGPSCITVP